MVHTPLVLVLELAGVVKDLASTLEAVSDRENYIVVMVVVVVVVVLIELVCTLPKVVVPAATYGNEHIVMGHYLAMDLA